LKGECLTLDFKYEIADAKKIARTFSAFANTCGGTLLIGVKDNGNISGIRSDEEEYMAESAGHVYCKPPVDYQLVTHVINEKTLLEIIIPESSEKPHTAPWKDDTYKAFVRVDDQNILANSVLLEVWKLKYKADKLVVQYNNYEQTLFELLRSNGRITLNDFISACDIQPYLAVKILAKLTVVKAIDMIISEKETYYTLLEGIEK
jgi:hypothetical protein